MACQIIRTSNFPSFSTSIAVFVHCAYVSVVYNEKSTEIQLSRLARRSTLHCGAVRCTRSLPKASRAAVRCTASRWSQQLLLDTCKSNAHSRKYEGSVLIVRFLSYCCSVIAWSRCKNGSIMYICICLKVFSQMFTNFTNNMMKLHRRTRRWEVCTDRLSGRPATR